jgi:hypothetical protein
MQKSGKQRTEKSTHIPKVEVATDNNPGICYEGNDGNTKEGDPPSTIFVI